MALTRKSSQPICTSCYNHQTELSQLKKKYENMKIKYRSIKEELRKFKKIPISSDKETKPKAILSNRDHYNRTKKLQSEKIYNKNRSEENLKLKLKTPDKDRVRRSIQRKSESSAIIKTKLKPEEILDSLEDKSWILDVSNLKLEEKVGRGSFSTVHKGTWTIPCAIKSYKKTEENLASFKKEYYVLSNVRSSFIVKLLAISLEPTLCSIMEYCEIGNVYHYLSSEESDGVISWKKIIQWLKQTATALNILHNWKPQIIHRDLKTFNLLLDKNLDVKVCDFGLSYISGISEAIESQTKRLSGTSAYLAPESIQSKKISSKVDIYSFGVIAWELCARILLGSGKKCCPFAEFEDITLDIQILYLVSEKGLRPTIPENCPSYMRELIDTCWCQDPEMRPSSKKLLGNLKKMEKNLEMHE